MTTIKEPEKLPEVIALVLGGGRGTRLYPLTHFRSKPAVPLAGKYRLIDVPISNCINSDISKIYCLTQFNSASLNRHIAQTYKFDMFTDGFVEIIAAEQTPDTDNWFQGTADAVRKSLRHVLSTSGDLVLILSGDALYRQNLQALVRQHVADKAEITVSCKLVNESEASSFGIVGIDETRRLISFHEKPKGDRLPPLKVEASVLQRAGLRDTSKPYLASMGIYLFNRDVLVDVLQSSSAEDFGKQIIPLAIPNRRIYADLFDGYWEDIGTIKAFFEANLDLLKDTPEFSFYDAKCPIYSHSRLLPSSEIVNSNVRRAMIAEGCLIKNATVDNCVIGIRSIISEGSELHNTVMMGADHYEEMSHETSPEGTPPMGVGRGTYIKNAIIDKNARIGSNVRITNKDNETERHDEQYSIVDGIVVVSKNAVIPDGTII
jgi:glucose-1-phosphate adenylyltransferase